MAKLVNLGSLGIDHVYGVEHITQQGETVSSKSYSVFPGGKGLNQSLAAAKAGAQVHHIGCIGEDGEWLRNVLQDGEVETEGVQTVEGSTGHAIIQVDEDGQNAIVIAGGTNRLINDDNRAFAFDLIEEGDWLLLQNEINDLNLVLDEAAARGIQVAFNVAPVDGREQVYHYDAVSVLIVNEVEAAAVAGVADPSAAFEALRKRYRSMTIVLTLGKDGGYCSTPNGEVVRYEAPSVNAVDETAAGDSFIGFFMAGLLAGESISAALALANAAGALAVTKAGAASSIPSLAAVKEFLKTQSN